MSQSESSQSLGSAPAAGAGRCLGQGRGEPWRGGSRAAGVGPSRGRRLYSSRRRGRSCTSGAPRKGISGTLALGPRFQDPKSRGPALPAPPSNKPALPHARPPHGPSPSEYRFRDPRAPPPQGPPPGPVGRAPGFQSFGSRVPPLSGHLVLWLWPRCFLCWPPSFLLSFRPSWPRPPSVRLSRRSASCPASLSRFRAPCAFPLPLPRPSDSSALRPGSFWSFNRALPLPSYTSTHPRQGLSCLQPCSCGPPASPPHSQLFLESWLGWIPGQRRI